MRQCVWSVVGLALLVACSKEPSAGENSRSKDESKTAAKASGNRPPTVKRVIIAPDAPRTDDDLVAEAVGEDADGDFVDFTYQWYVNDEPLLGEITANLSASRTRRGDKITVEVTPTDGKDPGTPRKASAVTVKNTSPKLDGEPTAGASLDGFRMSVSDVDEDPITYSLSGAPPNMTVDESGTLHFDPSKVEKSGSFQVTLTASDGQGGTVSVQFPVELTAAQAVPPSGPVTTTR